MKKHKDSYKPTYVNNCKSKFAAALYNCIKADSKLLDQLNNHYQRYLHDGSTFEYTQQDLETIFEKCSNIENIEEKSDESDHDEEDSDLEV